MKPFHPLFCFLTVVLSIFFLPGVNRAQEEPVGTVTGMTAPVSILRADGTEIVCEPGLPLFPGDTLSTGQNGQVRFHLQDSRQFMLQNKAEVSIDELSFEDDDQAPVLTLTLGYLWSQIAKIRDRITPLTIHTPTAVCGVRGTEFDTVVSLDSATLITVDDGSVEIEARDKKVTLNPGEMSEVETDQKIGAIQAAPPKEKRDRQAWRRQRENKLMQKLPRLIPRLRDRFEEAADKAIIFSSGLRGATADLRSVMAETGRAVKKKDRQKLIRLKKKLWYHMREFRKKADLFREETNRMQVLNKYSHHIEKFIAEHREQFAAPDLAAMETDLQTIAARRSGLKQRLRDTGWEIKQQFRQYRSLKKEMNADRQGKHP